MNFIPWYVTLLRILVPISILWLPLLGIISSMFADVIDWNLIGIKSKEMDEIYQHWDKSLDLYASLFILWVVLYWKDKWATKVAVRLFVYRLIGQVIFLVTKWRSVLFFFPNIFENFVILSLIIFWWTGRKKLHLDNTQKVVMFLVLLVPKLIQEYCQHVILKQPWELYSWGTFIKNPNAHVDTWLWIIALYVIPMLWFMFFLGKKRKY